MYLMMCLIIRKYELKILRKKSGGFFSPYLTLADEPTGNLDEENTRHVMELFAGLHREGMGILMVTHDPCVASYAKHVVMMEQGQIHESGSKV